ncbi:MAG: type II toxin-antitoxin system YafQ family toxin [Termitinemataceae bacterium]|nr:MAG: type II toxin-antitoxin system YafQ family toxin [Termitinemataceae bacterium]
MLSVDQSKQFKKDSKLMQKRLKDMRKMISTIAYLVNEIPLPPQYKEHPLHGNYSGSLECHIEPDWLMIYEIDNANKILYLSRTGTHSDLF